MGETHNEIQSPFLESAPLSHLGNKMTSGGLRHFRISWATSSIKKKNTNNYILWLHWQKKEYIRIIYQNISLT